MRKHCFTLVEILTALIIVGILAGMGLGIASYAQNKGKEMRTQATLKLIEQALEQYKRRFGDYPVLANSPLLDNVNQDRIGDAMLLLPISDITITDERIESESNLTEKEKLRREHVPNNFLGCFTGVSMNGTVVQSIAGMGNIGTNSGHYVILDGWDQPIIYIYPGVFNKTKYDLGSFGPDKKMGEDGFTFSVDKDSYEITGSPSFGTRSSGDYRDKFGLGDDMTNFKR